MQAAMASLCTPRPDQRHIRVDDVYRLAEFLKDYPAIEFNIEGNPEAGAEANGYPGFLELAGVSASAPVHASYRTTRFS